MDTIFDTIFILALDEEAGGLYESVAESLEAVMAGAILAELVLRERALLTDDHVLVTDPTPTEHMIMDRALYEIYETTRRRKLRYWINTLVYEEYLEEIGHHLFVKGVLVRKKKRLHLAAPADQGGEEKSALKPQLKDSLREITLGGKQPDLRQKVLLAFLYHADLLKIAFKSNERKKARKKIIQQIFDEDEISTLGPTLDTIVTMACK